VYPRTTLWICLLLLVLSKVPLPLSAQRRGQVPTDQPPSTPEQQITRAEQEMAKRANQQRQVELKRDTDKLFQLATELKQDVDKTNEGVLSLEVVKKAEEIEKLAHSVKERMKGPR
jgi:methyl-accepting chemotaxis protein